MPNLSELVTDWGGFEELVKRMHETGTVLAERNVKRVGNSGAERQIDVLITHKQGLYTHEVVAECKYWNTRVSRLHVDALATTIREVGASKGAIFSTKGFQSGAITQAKQEKIDLFTVREPTDEEWGLPGRHIDFWLRVVTMSMGHPQLKNVISFTGYEPDDNQINIVLGHQDRSSTPINRSSRKERTLEDLLENICREAVKGMQLPGLFKDENENSQGVAKAVTMVNVNFDKPMVTLHAGGVLVIPNMSFGLGISVDQSRFQFDRAENAIFMLALEDVVTKKTYESSQHEGEKFAKILPLGVDPKSIVEDPLINGSIFTVFTSALSSFDGFTKNEAGKFVFRADTT